MTQAINTPRGRAIEALVIHALRVCRLRSKKKLSHAEAWAEMQPLFDEQLALCKNANFEFSTLMARYLANLDFLSPHWLDVSFVHIFDETYSDNFRSALAGLTYATLTKRVYRLLADGGVVAAALDAKPNTDREAHRLIEFMCLALLWGEESLTSPRFKKLFEASREDELTAAVDWFWLIRGDKLTLKQTSMIIAFWDNAIIWARTQNNTARGLLAHLNRLSVHLVDLNPEAEGLLGAVVPYAGNEYEFQIVVEQLLRLAPENPAAATRLLGALIAANKPGFDFDDHLKNLLRALAQHGDRVKVLEYINQLTQNLPGMLTLYQEISQAPIS
jgi:hypothetical protein